jgi:hypothetical protein
MHVASIVVTICLSQEIPILLRVPIRSWMSSEPRLLGRFQRLDEVLGLVLPLVLVRVGDEFLFGFAEGN